jgi:two-component sensor histidine kinase
MMRIRIEDNGVGLGAHAPAPEGFGKTLVAMLARQLRATITWEDAQPGTRAVLAVPLAGDEVRAPPPAESVSPAA